MNTMNIGGYEAVITFDPDIQMFRGEFVGLNGGADFYAADAGFGVRSFICSFWSGIVF